MPKSKLLLKPCCSKYEKIARRYLDIVCSNDYRLRMIANLLLNIKDLECFDVESLEEISHMIDDYLDRKIVHENYFFGRSLRPCKYGAVDLGAEIHRVHAMVKESEELES